MEEKLKPGWLKCPNCDHIQEERETCEFCGASLAKLIRIKKLEQRLLEVEQKRKDLDDKISESSSEQNNGQVRPQSSNGTLGGILSLTFLLLVAVIGFAFYNAPRWPEEDRNAFLASCMITSGGRKSACKCLLRKVQRKYPDPAEAGLIVLQPALMDKMVKD